MGPLIRGAGIAALVIFAAFAMHTLNALYVEPRYLGFTSYADYALAAKLENASRSLPWLLSGLGHVLSGFAMVILALGAHAMFRELRPIAAGVALCAGQLAAVGFLLLGISHVAGRQALFLLADANPMLSDSAYMAATVARISFNALAQVGLGWFALQLSWCIIRTRVLSMSFAVYGLLSGAAGLLMAFAYIPVYLFTVLFWSLWLGVVLLRHRPATSTPGHDQSPPNPVRSDA
jgi:hypothetical protein